MNRGDTFNVTLFTRDSENVNDYRNWFKVEGVVWGLGELVTPVSNFPAAIPQKKLNEANLLNRGSYRFRLT